MKYQILETILKSWVRLHNKQVNACKGIVNQFKDIKK